jgi:hypothetical protein
MKIKIKSRKLVSELEEKMIEIMQTKINSCKTQEEKTILELYFKQSERRFVKTLKRNVEPMTPQELKEYVATHPVEPLNTDLAKKIDLMDQQIASTAKRIRTYREKYPKQLEKTFNQNQILEISQIRSQLVAPITTQQPSISLDTTIQDNLNKTVTEIHRLIQSLPKLTENVQKIKQVEKRKRK